jgi:hypothetical protein
MHRYVFLFLMGMMFVGDLKGLRVYCDRNWEIWGFGMMGYTVVGI